MSHELHYTSVLRGLKPGNVGLCTVATTEKLQPHLAERMEGLSGYRMVFPPGSPSANLNPVVVSHLKFSLGSQTYSIFSRVTFSGLDYSQRGNNYAHHVAIELNERPDGGPAWLASQQGFLDPAWTGEPRILASGRKPPKGDSTPKQCQAWAVRFGDAGWAGVLAQAFLDDQKKPAYLVFEPGQDVLPLFAEALALLPVTKRWDVSFSTYYTGQAQGLTCQWRAVLRDSPEHEQARRLSDALILDPAVANGLAPASKLVDAARSGKAIESSKLPPTAARRAAMTSVREVEKPGETEDQDWWFPKGKPESYDVVSPTTPHRPGANAPPRAKSAPDPSPRGINVPGRRTMSSAEQRAQMLLKVWIGSVACLVVALLCFTVYLLGPTEPPRQVALAGTKPEATSTPEQPDKVEPEAERPRSKKPAAEKPPPASEERKPDPVSPKPVFDPGTPENGTDIPAPPAPANPPKTAKTGRALLDYAGPFALNDTPLKYYSPFMYGNDKGDEVRQLKWTPRAGVQVRSISLIPPASKHLHTPLMIQDDPKGGTIQVQADGNGSGQMSLVGRFEIHDTEVAFKGNGESSAEGLESLEQCVLKVSLVDEDLYYRFGDEPKPPLPIPLKGSTLLSTKGITTPVLPKSKVTTLSSPFTYQVATCKIQNVQSHKELAGVQYTRVADTLGGYRLSNVSGDLTLRVYVLDDDLHIEIVPPAKVPSATWLKYAALKSVKNAMAELKAEQAKPPQPPPPPPPLPTVPSGEPTTATNGVAVKAKEAERPENAEDRIKALTYVIDALTIKEQCEIAYNLDVTFGAQKYSLRLRDSN